MVGGLSEDPRGFPLILTLGVPLPQSIRADPQAQHSEDGSPGGSGAHMLDAQVES